MGRILTRFFRRDYLPWYIQRNFHFIACVGLTAIRTLHSVPFLPSRAVQCDSIWVVSAVASLGSSILVFFAEWRYHKHKWADGLPPPDGHRVEYPQRFT